MNRFAAPAIGIGIMMALVAATTAVVAAPKSAGVKACESSSGDLALLSKGHCPKHYVKVTISKVGARGPKGARGAPGAAGPGSKVLRFKGVAADDGVAPPVPLMTVDGVTYSFACNWVQSDAFLEAELVATGANVESRVAVVGGPIGGAGDPALNQATGATTVLMLVEVVPAGNEYRYSILTGEVTVQGPPVELAQVSGFLEVTSGSNAATSSCDLEAQVTPAT
jgi:hypothetical protein